MNPSTEEILSACDQLPTDQVIILPNNKNIILAAQNAVSVSTKKVAVIPSRSIPQGISALFRYTPDANFDELVDEMNGALGDVISGEVTIATRTVEINGVNVREGEVIALLDGKLVASCTNLDDACMDLLEKANAADKELITLFYGNNIEKKEVGRIAGLIRAQYPTHEIEVKEGGQPHYQFIIAIE
jgi:dihydroxyacetone kinase-like predicted kinase